MKIAIPVANNKLSMHFGHCETFAIFTIKNEKAIENIETLDAPPHEPGLLPNWLAEKEVSIIIAGGMGQRAQALFTQKNIQVIVGAPSESPEQIVKLYLNGELQTGTNACDH